MRFPRALLVIFFLLTSRTGLSAEPQVDFIKRVFDDLAVYQGSAAKRASELSDRVKSYYDFAAMFHKASQDFSDRLSDEEKARLEALFSQLMNQKVIEKSDRMTGKKMEQATYLLEKTSPEEQIVGVRGKVKGKEIHLEFVVVPETGSFKITDLSIQGALLSRNYRGQFNRIFRVEGFAGLEKRLLGKLNPQAAGL